METSTHIDTDRAHRASEVLSAFVAEVKQSSASDIMQLMRREELSLPRLVALIFVEQHGAVAIKQISEHLNLALGTTSQVVDQLVCAGYVARAEDPSDRRHKLVTLTDKGTAIVHEARRIRVEELARRLAGMPAPLLEQMLDVVQQVTDFLAQQK